MILTKRVPLNGTWSQTFFTFFCASSLRYIRSVRTNPRRIGTAIGLPKGGGCGRTGNWQVMARGHATAAAAAAVLQVVVVVVVVFRQDSPSRHASIGRWVGRGPRGPGWRQITRSGNSYKYIRVCFCYCNLVERFEQNQKKKKKTTKTKQIAIENTLLRAAGRTAISRRFYAVVQTTLRDDGHPTDNDTTAICRRHTLAHDEQPAARRNNDNVITITARRRWKQQSTMVTRKIIAIIVVREVVVVVPTRETVVQRIASGRELSCVYRA